VTQILWLTTPRVLPPATPSLRQRPSGLRLSAKRQLPWSQIHEINDKKDIRVAVLGVERCAAFPDGGFEKGILRINFGMKIHFYAWTGGNQIKDIDEYTRLSHVTTPEQ